MNKFIKLGSSSSSVSGVVQSLVAGTNVTIDSTNPAAPVISATGGSTTFAGLSDKTTADIPAINTPLAAALGTKQTALVSGTNIKTINGNAILGSGDIAISGTSDHGALTGLTDDDHAQYPLSAGRAGGQTITGGTGVTDALSIIGTSGNGAASSLALQVKGGNNGASALVSVYNDGNTTIGGTTKPNYRLEVIGTAGVQPFSAKYYNGASYTTFIDTSAGGVILGTDGAAASIIKMVVNSQGGVPTNVFQAFRGSGGYDQKIIIDGNLGVGYAASVPTAKMDIGGDTIRLRTSRTPASASASGNKGDMCWDATYSYVAPATNTWRMSPTIPVGTATYTGTFQTLTGQTVTVVNGIISTVV